MLGRAGAPARKTHDDCWHLGCRILPRVPAIIVRTGIGPEFTGRNNCTNNEVNKCRVYEGCPEGTSTPDTGSQKLFALGASLTWFFLVKCCR